MKLARYSFYGPADPPAVPRILLSSSSRQVLMTFFMMIFGMRCVCSSSIPVKGEVALPKLNQASIVARSYVLPSAVAALHHAHHAPIRLEARRRDVLLQHFRLGVLAL